MPGHDQSTTSTRGVCLKCGFDLPHMTSHGQCYVCGGEVEWEVAPVIEPPSFFIDEHAGIGVHCSNCGYDLVGMHYQERCPECGGPAYRSDTVARIVAVDQLQRFQSAVRITGVGYLMQSSGGVLVAASLYLLPFVIGNRPPLIFSAAIAALVLGVTGLVATTGGWFRFANCILHRRTMIRTLASLRVLAAVILPVSAVISSGFGPTRSLAPIVSQTAAWISLVVLAVLAAAAISLIIVGGTILGDFASAAGRLDLQRLSKSVPTIVVIVGVLGSLVIAGPFIGSLIYGLFLLRAASMIPKSDSN